MSRKKYEIFLLDSETYTDILDLYMKNLSYNPSTRYHLIEVSDAELRFYKGEDFIYEKAIEQSKCQQQARKQIAKNNRKRFGPDKN